MSTKILIQLGEEIIEAGVIVDFSVAPRAGIRSPELLQLALKSSSSSSFQFQSQYQPSFLALTSCLANSLSDLLTKGLFTKTFTDVSILLIEPSICPDYVRDAAFQALLIILGVARVRSITKSMSCLLSTARSTALIIDFSAFECAVTPIVSGREILQPSLFCPLQGQVLGLNSIYACAALIILTALSKKIKEISSSENLSGGTNNTLGADDHALGAIPEFKTEFSCGLTIVQPSPVDTSGGYKTTNEWWPLETINRSSVFAKSNKQAACEYAFSLWIDSVIKKHGCLFENEIDNLVSISIPSNLFLHSGCALPETITISASLWSKAFQIPFDLSAIYDTLDCVHPSLCNLSLKEESLSIVNSLLLRTAQSCEQIAARSSSSLQSITLDALLAAPIDTRRPLSASIVLSGWIFSIPGFSQKFFQSLSYLVDPAFDICASLAHHADVGPVKGFADGLAESRTREIKKRGSVAESSCSVYTCLRPLLPLLCPSNVTHPSITAFTGAAAFLRVLSSTRRLVPDTTDSITSTTTSTTGSKLSASDKLKVSDAFIESSVTRSALLKQLCNIVSGQIAIPEVGMMIRKQKIDVKPPIVLSTNAASAASNNAPIDTRAKLAALSSKLNKAKK